MDQMTIEIELLSQEIIMLANAKYAQLGIDMMDEQEQSALRLVLVPALRNIIDTTIVNTCRDLSDRKMH